MKARSFPARWRNARPGERSTSPGAFGIDPVEVAVSFAERDLVMRDHARYETVELWFEHDLYDQLQLIQILSFFSGEGRADGITLVQADDFLGRQRPETILRFADAARPIVTADLDLGDEIWSDLVMPTPEAIARRLDFGDGDRLPVRRRGAASLPRRTAGAADGLGPHRGECLGDPCRRPATRWSTCFAR